MNAIAVVLVLGVFVVVGYLSSMATGDNDSHNQGDDDSWWL